MDIVTKRKGRTKMSDLISRQAAIEALEKHEKSKGHNYSLFVDVVSECEEIIRNLPSAEEIKAAMMA